MDPLEQTSVLLPDTAAFYHDNLRLIRHPDPAQPDGVTHDAQEVETLCASLLENAVDGVYGLDLNGFVVFVNPAARRLTGWSLDDLRGRTQHSMVHHSHADGSQYHKEECPIYAAFRDGRVHRRDDEVFWRKDGTSFPVAYSSAPLFRHGKPYGAVVVFRDRTEELRRQQWDAARIEALTALLRGDTADRVLQSLCDAFTAFQPRFALRIVCGDSVQLSRDLRHHPRLDALQSIRVQPANGGAAREVHVLSTGVLSDADALPGAVRDVVQVIELAS